jgi:hypothetical protein
MKPPHELVIAEDGAFTSASPTATELLAANAGRYRIVEGPPGLLLLERTGSALDKRSRVLSMGEIVSKTTVLEMIAIITSNGWRGQLSVIDPVHTRTLRLDQGAIKGAQSSVPNERLGEVMVSLGALSPEQLGRCVLGASPERRLGEIAIAQGFVDQKLLFEMLQAQAERIFQNALLVSSGHYTFVLPAEDNEAPATQLHLPMQALLMESVQRIDEMAHFRERIPSGDLHPVLTDGAARITLGESLRPVAAMADGARSIVEIGRELRLDEFEVTRRVMQLLQIGCLELKEKKTLGLEGVERIVKQLNELLREIRDTVERHAGAKGAKQMLWTLQAWVRDTQISDYFGDATRLDGDISTDATLRKLQGLRVERPLEELHRAAHELVSFAMFSATPSLPREAERALSKWVNQRLSRMRL